MSLTRSSESYLANQTPTLSVSPSFDYSEAYDCAELCAEIGFDLIEWQRTVLVPWLAVGRDGHWVSKTVGLSAPRQNGKTGGPICARSIWGMVKHGERIIYTAHVQSTSEETFEAVASKLTDTKLSRYVLKVNEGSGRQSIHLRNGGRMKFLARTSRAGRGQMETDTLIYDEAQYLTREQQRATLPSQKSSGNPQTIYGGTPAHLNEDGLVFRGIRERALSGDADSVAYAEWSVPEMPKNPRDPALWYATNPSLGIRVLPECMEKDCNEMDPEDFAIEDLGLWLPLGATVEPPAIDPDEWRACTVDDPEASEDERVTAGVKFSPDGSTYSLSVAARGPEGPVLLECLERESTSRGIGHLVDWILDRKSKLALVCVDGREWTATLVQRLADLGYPKKGLHIMRTAEVVDACAMLSGAVIGRNVAHIDQPLLAQSVETSTRRPIGREGWAFQGPDPTPIESTALAYWGAMTTKRNPKRRMKVSV